MKTNQHQHHPYLKKETPSPLVEASKRAVRTLVQLFASGGVTALLSLLFSKHMSAEQAGVMLGATQVAVTFTHNFLEDAGFIPTFLK